jgi:hypothetical protein
MTFAPAGPVNGGGSVEISVDDGVNTVIGESRGHVHAGLGNQYIHSTVVVNDHVRTGASRSTWVTEGRIHWLEQRFTPPGNYVRAADVLGRERFAVLVGDMGVGRRAAAMMLLRAAEPDAARFRELDSSTDDDTSLMFGALPIDRGERLLLDVRVDYGVTDLSYELSLLRSAVRRHGAYLVVIADHLHEDLLADELQPLVVPLARPAGHQVLTRNLRADGIHVTAADLMNATLDTQLATYPMREIARLAQFVSKAKALAKSGTTVADWLPVGIESAAQHGGLVARKVQDLRNGEDRALLLAAALLEGASADAVLTAARGLLRIVKYPAAATHALEQADLCQRLNRINATTDARRRVRLPTFTYGALICRHFWSNFPDLRPDFDQWVDAVVRTASVTADDRSTLAGRFADVCLWLDRCDVLLDTIESWADPGLGWTNTLAQPTTVLLEKGLTHEKHGARFRRQVYAWSRDDSIPAGLAHLLIIVCLDVLAPTQPDQALVRLHHLTAHRSRSVATAAVAALLQLTQDERTFRRVLKRVTDRLAQTGPNRADLALLSELGDPARVVSHLAHHQIQIPDDIVRRQLVIVWQALMRHSGPADWSARARRWLTACLPLPEGDVLMTILIHAAGADRTLLGSLYVVARDWVIESVDQRDRARRLPVAQRFIGMIDHAQGLTPEDFLPLRLGGAGSL